MNAQVGAPQRPPPIRTQARSYPDLSLPYLPNLSRRRKPHWCSHDGNSTRWQWHDTPPADVGGGWDFGCGRRGDDHHRPAASPARHRAVLLGRRFPGVLCGGFGHVERRALQETEGNAHDEATQRSCRPSRGASSAHRARPGPVEKDAGRGGCDQSSPVGETRARAKTAPDLGWDGGRRVHRAPSDPAHPTTRSRSRAKTPGAPCPKTTTKQSAATLRSGPRGVADDGRDPGSQGVGGAVSAASNTAATSCE
jgi:hypothetical protein